MALVSPNHFLRTTGIDPRRFVRLLEQNRLPIALREDGSLGIETSGIDMQTLAQPPLEDVHESEIVAQALADALPRIVEDASLLVERWLRQKD